MKKMDRPEIKICFVASVDLTLKFLLLSQIKFFKNEGCDVYAVCSPGKWIGSLEKEGIKIKKIAIKRKVFSPFSDSISLFRLFFYFKKEKFDVVFTSTPKAAVLGQLAAKIAGVPIILNNVFGFYFHEGTPYFQRKFFVFIEKLAARCSNQIFFRNKEDFETAKKEKIGKNNLIKYAGDGIDIIRFNSQRFSQEFIREKKEKIGICAGVPVIGIVARLVAEKGYLELFEAFKSVLEKFPETIIAVVGSTDNQKKDSIDSSIVKNFGIEKNVFFLGERDDVDEIYPLIDIFVLPSHREGFSHSIMEASAMARPVIATDIRGCRGAVEPGVTGLLVPPKNSQKLAEAIIYLFSNPDEAKRMGEAGRKKAEKEFDENKIFSKIKDEYSRLSESKLSDLSRFKKYLITGGAGFIGSSLANSLARNGERVIVIDNFLNKSGQKLDPSVKFFELDVSDKKVSGIFKKERPDVVYHLAGPMGLRKNKTDPAFIASLNFLDNFKKILDYSVLFNVKKVIFLSSGGAIYSGSDIIPTSEECAVQLKSIYGSASLDMESLLADYGRQKNLDYAILRFSNVYGPGQWQEGVVPSFIKQTLENKAIIINGDGNQTRDFIFIDDAVSALKIAKSLQNGIWNVGSGKEVSLNQLAERISEILKIKLKTSHSQSLESTNRSCLDISKINRHSGWEPKIGLDAGLKKTIDWYEKRFKN